jgi:hypothetical protein
MYLLLKVKVKQKSTQTIFFRKVKANKIKIFKKSIKEIKMK